MKELEGLFKSGTWKILCSEDVTDNADILGGRFVVQIKDEGTYKKIWKASFLVQGYKDRMKQSLVHDTSVSRQ